MVRVRLDLAYDGSEFAGWAKQPELRTVQGELEAALERILRAPAQVTVAGRTDAGVHALSQVVHLDIPHETWLKLGQGQRARGNRSAAAGVRALQGDTDVLAQSPSPAREPSDVLAYRLAAVLPSDVVVHRVRLAPPGFDARFSAGSRRYVYRIDDGEAPDPRQRGYVLHHRGRLDVAAMDAASRKLVGLHDFAAFCKAREGATTIRRLISFAWRRPLTGLDTGLVLGTIRADAFCHNMVRALVGSIIKVGEGRAPIDWPYQVLLSGERQNAAAIVSPHGLTLEQITYPPAPFDAERASQIRAKRILAD